MARKIQDAMSDLENLLINQNVNYEFDYAGHLPHIYVDGDEGNYQITVKIPMVDSFAASEYLDQQKTIKNQGYPSTDETDYIRMVIGAAHEILGHLPDVLADPKTAKRLQDMDETERLIFHVMDKELKAIVWFGALFGFLMGFINLLF